MNTTIIKGSTKRGQSLLAGASTFLGTDLFDVYGTVSRAKYNALCDCKEMYDDMGGYNFRITNRNSYRFTVAWECEYLYVDTKTGECVEERATVVRTKDNLYVILLDR